MGVVWGESPVNQRVPVTGTDLSDWIGCLIRTMWRRFFMPGGEGYRPGGWHAPVALAIARLYNLSSRESRRSARGLPPVWQVAQYWSEESANETSRIVSPQTGQGWPVLPCTRSPVFFSPLSSAAASPAERDRKSVV